MLVFLFVLAAPAQSLPSPFHCIKPSQYSHCPGRLEGQVVDRDFEPGGFKKVARDAYEKQTEIGKLKVTTCRGRVAHVQQVTSVPDGILSIQTELRTPGLTRLAAMNVSDLLAGRYEVLSRQEWGQPKTIRYDLYHSGLEDFVRITQSEDKDGKFTITRETEEPRYCR
jgi:hypothetical protein